MLKKTIKYETFDGEEQEEDFYFHFSKADLVEMEVTRKGGLKTYLERIIASQDGAAIMKEFKELILGSVGQRSEDGSRFLKTKEIREDFEASAAYEALFIELVTDANKAAEFINGIIPKQLADQVQASVPKPATVAPTPGPEKDPTGLTEPTEPRLLTRTEITEMDEAELRRGLEERRYRLS